MSGMEEGGYRLQTSLCHSGSQLLMMLNVVFLYLGEGDVNGQFLFFVLFLCNCVFACFDALLNGD
jgi:hypothetical protein